MKLTVEEQQILNGESGELLQKFMHVLVGTGECFDAPYLIPVNSVHVPSLAVGTLGEAGRKLLANMVDAGLRCKTNTTVNPSGTDCSRWQELGIPADEYEAQSEIAENIIRLGATLSFNCTPYLMGNVPRFREHIAWGEISAVIYANSALGARTNPEGAPSAWASAFLGKTPLYGWHLDENRYGQFIVDVKTEIKDPIDYGALVLYGSRIHPELIPVFTGLPPSTSSDNLKTMSGALYLENKSKMFHAVGITPDAPTLEAALGNKRPQDTIEFGQRELAETIHHLNTDKSQDISWVVLGCPHCSINEMAQIASALERRKVSPSVKLWITTSRPVKALADRMGQTEIIEKAGGMVLSETCPAIFTRRTIENLGYKSMVTNSVVLAHSMGEYLGASNSFQNTMHFGNLGKCIDAAVSGTWR
ncbi:aconitase X [Chloroflexota bacterium]